MELPLLLSSFNFLVFACIAKPSVVLGVGFVALMVAFKDTIFPFLVAVFLTLAYSGGHVVAWSLTGKFLGHANN